MGKKKELTEEQVRTTELWHHYIAVEGLSEKEARRRMAQIKKNKAKMEKILSKPEVEEPKEKDYYSFITAKGLDEDDVIEPGGIW